MGRGRLSLLAAGLAWIMGCHHAEPAAVAPPVSVGRWPAVVPSIGMPATMSATPAPFERAPFVYGPFGELAVYDRASMDILLFPGAGRGLENPSEYAPYQLCFDDRRDIWLLDVWKEERLKLVDGREVGGFAFSPSFDSHDNLYFLGSSRSDREAARAYAKFAPTEASESLPAPLGPYLGKAHLLVAINALAARHGGVTGISVNGPGDLVVFATVDGGVYLYDPRTHQVQALLASDELADRGAATSATLDPVWGRFVVWEDARRHGLWVFDRWTGQFDPVPYSRLGMGRVSASSPQFYGNDPYHVVFTATFADGGSRLLVYDLVTERMETLSLLNLLRAAP